MTTIGKGQVDVSLNSDGVLSDAQNLLGALGVEFGKFSELIGPLLGVAVVAGIGKELFNIGEELQNAQATLRTETGATGRAFRELWQDVKDVSTTVPVSIGDAATVVGQLRAQLGLTGPKLVAVADEIVNLSNITHTDLATNVTLATQLFERFGIGANRMPGILDEVFRAFQHTGISISTLIGDLIQGEPVLHQFGLSFVQQLALEAEFEKRGANVTQMLTGYREALTTLTKIGSDTTTELTALSQATGLSAHTLEELQDRPKHALEEITGLIRHAGSEARATAIAVAIFGTRAGPEMVKALFQGGEATRQLQHQIEYSRQTIDQTALSTRTFGQNMQVLGNELDFHVAPAADWVASEMVHLSAVLGKDLPRGIGVVRHDFATLPAPVKEAWHEIVGINEGAWRDLVTTGKAGAALLLGVVDGFGDLLHGRWTDLARDIEGIWSDWGADMLRLERVSLGTVVSAIASTGEAAYNAAGRLGYAIVHGLEHALSGISGDVKHDLSGIAGDVTGALGSITGLASGGIVTHPTLAVVGEHGPEAVVPLRGLVTGPNAGVIPLPTAQAGAGNWSLQVFLDGQEVGGRMTAIVRDELGRVARQINIGQGAVWQNGLS